MERESHSLLQIAVQREYLSEEAAREVGLRARLRRCSAERILLEEGLLSVRRIERLRTHLTFRTMRKNDKRYAELAIKQGWIEVGDAKQGLRHQKRVFAKRRECVRLGSWLIEQDALTVEQDRELRMRVLGRRPSNPTVPAVRDEASSFEATIPLHEDSQIKSNAGPCSYRAIEAALERVEAIRAVQEEMSTSDHIALASPDSAAEFENACRMLARRRTAPGIPAGRPDPDPEPERRARAKRKKKKSTGTFLAALLSKGAA